MLRSELPFSTDGWLRRALAAILGEAFLGFLAILALGLALFPMLFDLGTRAAAGIEVAQWAIIGWFAVEFIVAFAAARDKSAFLQSPWRWLDFVTILIALASLLPSASAALRSSPILRLARIGRLVSLGLRASGLSTRRRVLRVAGEKARGPAQVQLLDDEPGSTPQPADIDELLAWLATDQERWYHVTNPGKDELREIGAKAGLPPGFLEAQLWGTNYPHWARAGSLTGVFLWVPDLDEHRRADPHGMFFLPIGGGVLSLSRRKLHAIARMDSPRARDEGKLSFPGRVMTSVFERVVQGNQDLAGRCEQGLRELEDVPVRESRPEFFERTFLLKKELSAAQADLWRVKGIADDLANGRVSFAGIRAAESETFQRFAGDVHYLYETLVNIREEVLSVIELHLNVVSFEMNRVMRVLAVVSVLGLIPAVIAGLLGVNVIGSPWPFTLPQVAFVMLFAMALGAYFFLVKGWLR
jgi:Mg2+ and Co2+ transporter CorA